MIELSVAAAEAVAPVTFNHITIRQSTPDDETWVDLLQALAFGPGRFARAAFRVRERFPVDAHLGLIAEIGGVRVSSVMMTPISVGGINGYLLGPLATDPVYRNRGAGKALVREVTRRALARREGRFVMLVGDPPYYMPLGFQPTSHGAITFPGPVDPKRILVHSPEPELAMRLEGEIAAFRAQ
ncbi:MAG: N-acetyltransferase [Alphaproteobacteria bacterium]|nr:N-acetyltransferase [Alphaproteobacteria bacterium]